MMYFHSFRLYLLGVLVSILLSFTHASAQQPLLYTLTGHAIIRDEGDCRYRISFSINGTSISGYSVTTMANGAELRAGIKGSIDKAKKTLRLKEYILPQITQDDACLFDMKLAEHKDNAHTVLSGPFTGHDIMGNVCGTGSVVFDLSPTLKEYMEAGRPVEKKTAIQPASPAAAVPVQPAKISATEAANFQWSTDTIRLEIWDGEVVDGDKVSITLNGNIVLTDYAITSGRKLLLLPLTGKTNTIAITGEDEGKAPPCTARILLADGAMQHTMVARVARGESAIITITKK